MSDVGGLVTAEDVDRLWLEAIELPAKREVIHRDAEALLERVNSESPVVNWGLTSLHALTLSPKGSEELSVGRDRWRGELAEYRSDPAAWMTRYFVTMVRAHTNRAGLEQARVFAAKLIRQEQISADDFPPELRP